MTTAAPRELSVAEELVTAVERGGGTMTLAGEDIELFLPDNLTHILPALKEHKQKIVDLLRQQNSWPTPLSYPEYFCRLRAAGFTRCSREAWEAAHGSDAERMARYERKCRWGASRDVVQ
jgi:hypothetical protein